MMGRRDIEGTKKKKKVRSHPKENFILFLANKKIYYFKSLKLVIFSFSLLPKSDTGFGFSISIQCFQTALLDDCGFVAEQ